MVKARVHISIRQPSPLLFGLASPHWPWPVTPRGCCHGRSALPRLHCAATLVLPEAQPTNCSPVSMYKACLLVLLKRKGFFLHHPQLSDGGPMGLISPMYIQIRVASPNTMWSLTPKRIIGLQSVSMVHYFLPCWYELSARLWFIFRS